MEDFIKHTQEIIEKVFTKTFIEFHKNPDLDIPAIARKMAKEATYYGYSQEFQLYSYSNSYDIGLNNDKEQRKHIISKMMQNLLEELEKQTGNLKITEEEKHALLIRTERKDAMKEIQDTRKRFHKLIIRVLQEKDPGKEHNYKRFYQLNQKWANETYTHMMNNGGIPFLTRTINQFLQYTMGWKRNNKQLKEKELLLIIHETQREKDGLQLKHIAMQRLLTDLKMRKNATTTVKQEIIEHKRVLLQVSKQEDQELINAIW